MQNLKIYFYAYQMISSAARETDAEGEKSPLTQKEKNPTQRETNHDRFEVELASA
jgi:hypothetical protein